MAATTNIATLIAVVVCLVYIGNNAGAGALPLGSWTVIFTDDFNRPDGAPGPDWLTPMPDGQGGYLPALDIFNQSLCSTTQAVAIYNQSLDSNAGYRLTYRFIASENEVNLGRFAHTHTPTHHTHTHTHAHIS